MNPNQVPISYTFTLDQVNMILAGLGKLPFEQVSEFVNGIRGVALQALKEAEDAAKAESASAADRDLVEPGTE